MTNLTEITGDWNVIKGKLKKKYGILTDQDMILVEGKQDEMLTRLQAILGHSKEEIHKVISEL